MATATLRPRLTPKADRKVRVQHLIDKALAYHRAARRYGTMEHTLRMGRRIDKIASICFGS